MKPTLQLRIGQQLSMTPQLQQAIRLLQLSSLDLQQEIQEALDKNPMLEAMDDIEPSNSTNENDVTDPNAEQHDSYDTNELLDSHHENDRKDASETQVNDYIDDNAWASEKMNGKTKESHHQSTGNEIERLTSHDANLQEHLLWQMQLTPFSLTDCLIATTLIDSINEDGYLTSTIEDIYTTLKEEVDIDIEEVEAVLHRIQQFDPVGVGARNLSECLRVQLQKLSPDMLWRNKAIELVCTYLDLLAKRDYAALRKYLQLSLEDLRQVIQLIQTQNPRPGREIGGASSEYITPDVFVRKRFNRWVVDLNPECTPSLKINANYAGMIRRADSSRDNQFLRNQLQEARWFLKSIENRNETLIKVSECIVEAQHDFFELGDVGMKPLILHQVADKVGMHESTISRITNQKYMHTPRGTFELKYFFSSHVTTASGGECSATAIRAHIKKLIAEENHQKPLSDDKLAKLLAEEGIQVARRTVAKYREAMTIPPSNERKKLI
ncbi:RNA polymerase factor sigma-54 [Candidatus Berkiella cookevillensis]|uniref:RNA polymerase sigma-54 factor n=1 Tax=Candidatus Berkiella cookevillensis TaxID=437022 RepID=A0A0Q9YC18_9GAMM|nr:RNA polymerase factor sigma-54 [Candidatus Berkiella cookevillensis]MCS5709237.1 RNA polymerase factor sigma-54 [Candidatus Berkiella cookevillensis]